MTYADTFKLIRSCLKLSQSQFCEATGLSINTLKRYETGERIPKPDQIEKMAKSLSLPSFLLDESNYGYIKLDTQGDLLALIIDQIKKGILTIDGESVRWLGIDGSVTYEGADMVLLNKWYELWSAGKTDEADRLQIQIAFNNGGVL